MIPEQIIAGEILQMPLLDLEQRILAAFEQNPALVLEEVGLCPMCDTPVSRYPCPACGHSSEPREDEVPVVLAEDWESYREALADGDDLEPFAGIAARQTLGDYLHGQWLVMADESSRGVGEYLINCLDEDGYLTEPLIEVADRFRLSVPQVESVLRQVQALDPPGVGARDLRECLLIQCSRYEGDEGDECDLAEQILREAWSDLAAHRWERIAQALKIAPEDAEEAADWIRHNLAPYPGRSYRESWEDLAPREEPAVTPDVIIRKTDDGFVVEIVESSRFQVGIDAEYLRLYESLGRRAGSNADLEPVRRAVADARFLIEGIANRRRTLHRVMVAVAEAQADFLLRGRAYLKPLMQKTIAAEIGIYESTVCRALADKMVRIPSGETIPTSQFFDASMPVKEALQDLIRREDPAQPFSDSRLAELLSLSGYKIARRTVAKYREALRIPPIELRQRAQPALPR